MPIVSVKLGRGDRERLGRDVEPGHLGLREAQRHAPGNASGTGTQVQNPQGSAGVPAEIPSFPESHIHHLFGLWAGDEHGRSHFEAATQEPGLSQHILKRLTAEKTGETVLQQGQQGGIYAEAGLQDMGLGSHPENLAAETVHQRARLPFGIQFRKGVSR